MNPFTFLPLALRVLSTLRPTSQADEPAPAPTPTKRRGKAVEPAPAPIVPKVVKRNWRPLVLALATAVTVGAGLYSGHIDGTAALTMLGTIDLAGILALFGG